MSITEKVTQNVTNNTINFVQSQIAAKNSSVPYYADTRLVHSAVTDMDVFPYPRFYRGVPDHPDPIVFEREAGFRNHYQAGYTPQVEYPKQQPPNVCFQPACTTVFPCMEDSELNQARKSRNMKLNKQIGHNISV